MINATILCPLLLIQRTFYKIILSSSVSLLQVRSVTFSRLLSSYLRLIDKKNKKDFVVLDQIHVIIERSVNRNSSWFFFVEWFFLKLDNRAVIFLQYCWNFQLPVARFSTSSFNSHSNCVEAQNTSRSNGPNRLKMNQCFSEEILENGRFQFRLHRYLNYDAWRDTVFENERIDTFTKCTQLRYRWEKCGVTLLSSIVHFRNIEIKGKIMVSVFFVKKKVFE